MFFLLYKTLSTLFVLDNGHCMAAANTNKECYGNHTR